MTIITACTAQAITWSGEYLRVSFHCRIAPLQQLNLRSRGRNLRERGRVHVVCADCCTWYIARKLPQGQLRVPVSIARHLSCLERHRRQMHQSIEILRKKHWVRRMKNSRNRQEATHEYIRGHELGHGKEPIIAKVPSCGFENSE